MTSYPETNKYRKTLFKISTFCLRRGRGEKESGRGEGERGRREGRKRGRRRRRREGGGGEKGGEALWCTKLVCRK